MTTRRKSVRTALRQGGPELALSTLADDLAARLDACADPDERLTLTRAFLVVMRDLSVNERAKHRMARDRAAAGPAKPNALALVESLRGERGA